MMDDKSAEPIGKMDKPLYFDGFRNAKLFFVSKKAGSASRLFHYILLTFVGCVDDFFQF